MVRIESIIESINPVLHECEYISPNWLLLNKGNKYKSSLSPITGNEAEFEVLEGANKALLEKIKGLEKTTISLQESLIQEKDKRLTLYESCYIRAMRTISRKKTIV